jgi:hypothetical protein
MIEKYSSVTVIHFLKNEDMPSTSNQCVGAISSNDAYFSEVCRASAVVPVGLTFMAFAVQDFDVVKGLLKVTEDILVAI